MISLMFVIFLVFSDMIFRATQSRFLAISHVNLEMVISFHDKHIMEAATLLITN